MGWYAKMDYLGIDLSVLDRSHPKFFELKLELFRDTSSLIPLDPLSECRLHTIRITYVEAPYYSSYNITN